MEITTKHYGGKRYGASSIIELTFKDSDLEYTTNVVDLNGKVDVKLIENLRDIANELEEQNNLINK